MNLWCYFKSTMLHSPKQNKKGQQCYKKFRYALQKFSDAYELVHAINFISSINTFISHTN